MKHVQALIIDTTGIQNYIYASNKLKANIGASYIVSELFRDETFKKELRNLIQDEVDLESWKTSEHLKIFDSDIRFEVGYIGGGNAFLFFSEDTQEKAKKLTTNFIRAWSKELLCKASGLRVTVAQKSVDDKETLNDKEKFLNFKQELSKLLNQNKSRYTPVIDFLHLGITSPCRYTDLTANANYYDHNEKTHSFVSGSAYAKLKLSDTANDKLVKDLEKELGGEYTFTTDQEDFGQKINEKNFLAIVHIDGNGIGKLFEECENLAKTRELSLRLEEIIQNGFKQLVSELTKIDWKDDKIKEIMELKNDKNRKGELILPIRPIVLSGDDITFVCEGRLGLYLTKRFMELIKDELVLGEKISYCAGVCITNTNFPFYRAYKLAEEVCLNAKKKVKPELEITEKNWIDFHVQYGGFSGSLQEVRKQFITPQGKLLQRPYQIGGNNREYSFDVLIQDTKELNKLPNSILHEFREVLWKTETEQKQFLEINKTRKSKIQFEKFKITKEDYPPEKLFNTNGHTHYFDMIELSEFYPWFILEEE